MLKKTVKVNNKAPNDAETKALVEGTYTFTIESTNLDPKVTRKIAITFNDQGEAVSFTGDGATIADGTVTVAGLSADNYKISETATDNDYGSLLTGAAVTIGNGKADSNDNSVTVTVTAGDSATVPTAEFTNNIVYVKVQKTDIKTGEELTGAHIVVLRIVNGAESKVDEWDSEKGKPHVVTGLTPGYEYILRETAAPDDYLTTVDTYFTILVDGTAVSGRALTRESNDGSSSPATPIRDDGVLLVQDAPLTKAEVFKIWVDDGNRDGKRPPSLTVELKADGVPTGKTVTLSDANNWYDQITGLPKYGENGEDEIEYTWTEPSVTGYTPAGTKKTGTLTTLTNTCPPETVKIQARKDWKDSGTHPNSVTVQLYADGLASGDPVTLDAANGWKTEWTDLCRYINQNGARHEIVYTVAETEIPEGYVCKVTGNAERGFVITNTLKKGSLRIRKAFDIQEPEDEDEEQETTDIEVVKKWEDNDNKDGNRPESITVHLFAGGEEIKSAKLTAKNGWKHRFGELPKFVNGHPIHYFVTEDPVDWYVAEIDGFTITNKYQPELTSVTVQKIWNDNNNKLKLRPKKIRMTLNNGRSVVLNEENGWTATITGLPARVNGKPAEYTWTEPTVLSYEQESVKTDGSVTVFKNRLFTRDETTPPGKSPRMPGEPDKYIDDYDTPLGIEVIINHVGDCFD